MRNLLIILIVVLIGGCSSSKKVGHSVYDSITVDKTTIQQDTVIQIAADTSLYQALVTCDSLGRAYLSEIETLNKGKRSSLIQPTLTPLPFGSLLSLGCTCDSMAIYLAMHRITERIHQTKSKSEVVTVEVNKLNWWQQT
ncbi:MAG TPA: hypothetical protein PLC47_09405, partial [Bacteroidales bacterium]|nr:hypothetical protein [Bacteroidales bacterium]